MAIVRVLGKRLLKLALIHTIVLATRLLHCLGLSSGYPSSGGLDRIIFVGRGRDMGDGRFTKREHTYGDIHVVGKLGTVTAGKYCSIGGHVTAILVGHNTSLITTYPFMSREFRHKWGAPASLYDLHPTVRDVVIGNDVWIGNNAILLGGTVVGDGAVIGAGAVVCGIVEPYSIVVGNPARLLRLRFRQEQIDALLRIQWWNWTDERVRANLSLICSTNLSMFISLNDTQEGV